MQHTPTHTDNTTDVHSLPSEELWLHIFSDAIIAACYLAVAAALYVLKRKRPDNPLNPIFMAFMAFLMLCGFIHVLEIYSVWLGSFQFHNIVKIMAAMLSLVATFVIWRRLPTAFNVPSAAALLNANEELQKTNLRIEQQVAERTAALEATTAELEEKEKQMRLAYDEARRANAAKSEFLAHMSHEIRTPLSSVTTIADILPRTGNFNAKQTELIETLQVGAHSLLDLINDILDISKIEAGEFELYERPYEWDSLIADTARVISVRAEEKNLTLRTNTGAISGTWLMGDRARLKQVLLNLLSNSLKFTDEGEISLTANVNNRHGNAPQLIIAISDTGIGIPETQKELIFEKFRQSDCSVSGNHGGTGLGLAITRHLVGLMGGTITLQSTVGKGSTFTITMPLREVDATEANAVTINTTNYDTSKDTRKILLVEDYPGNIIVATSLLDELGYSYDIARNGREALELQEQDVIYYAVLMDINMPEINGLEATRKWRESEERRGEPRVPIIGLTAHALTGDDAQCFDAGMDDYAAKPLTLETLQDVLDKYCSKSNHTA
ncbi:MAG: ATP-binding protein [Alphaproteobacteria bacterium]|nr:ATP-binding protein [Alphaproteobacteria bacterium]